jgi:hypothetical protein
MGKRSRGFGPSLSFPKQKGFDSVTRPQKRKSPGLYPEAGEGGIRVPTLIESYNRESDHSRWLRGMEIWQDTADDSWVERKLGLVAHLKTGPILDAIPLVTYLFPGRSSGESAWHVTLRPRGALTLPAPIEAGSVTLDRGDPDPSKHRLIYNVRGVIDRSRLSVWTSLIGDQFEDSALGPKYPDDLDPQPTEAVAFTLVEVDVSGFRLIFDLSRPFVRRITPSRLYWKLGTYNPGNPLRWRDDGSRHLCSSHRFECSCPDYQGRQVANLQSREGVSENFPMPAAGRDPVKAWERESFGYSKKWFDLDPRVDRRRECKHIHAVRWEAEVPFDEPRDTPIRNDPGLIDLRKAIARERGFGDVRDFYAKHMVTFDLLLLGVAPAVGLQLDADGELRGAEATFRPVNRPILWTDEEMPLYSWCRQNDWWLPRGTAEVWLFDPPSGGFVRQLGSRDVLEIVSVNGVDVEIPLPAFQRVARLGVTQGTQGQLLLRMSTLRFIRGKLTAFGGLGKSRLVKDVNIAAILSSTGGLSGTVYSYPEANLGGTLSGQGRLSGLALSAIKLHAISGTVTGQGGLGGSTLPEAVRKLLIGPLVGQGGLGESRVRIPPPRPLLGAVTGRGGTAGTLRAAPAVDYFADWAVQNYGFESLGLIEWWGS